MSRIRAVQVPATKFVAPMPRPEHLARPRQLERIDPHAGLVLLSAPAGYGKTTLIGQWIRERHGGATAWVQLDAEDSGAYVFWTAIVTALANVDQRVGQRSFGALATTVDDFLASVVGPLIDDLAHCGDPIALVLDDMHFIDDALCHRTLAWFVERAPANLRIAIATRRDPELPLGRLRARGHMTELRAEDLRFDADEGAAFLNEQLELGLEQAEVQALLRRTEGWPAGLYLAALSMRRTPDRKQFVAAFAGDNEHVVDYLAPEILGAVDARQRRFLGCTSILDRFCAPLCDAVIGDDDGAATAAETLAELDGSNMFLVALDSRRRWYRYHHLFRDLLRAELDRLEPAIIRDLHVRAAAWYGTAGLVPDAITHALLAGDRIAAAELIAERYLDLYRSEGWPRLAGWLAQLPEEEVAGVPGFLVAKAFLAWLVGDRDEVARIAAIARAHDRGAPLPDGGTSTEAMLALLDALYPYGDATRARGAALRAAELETGAAHALTVHYVLGMTSFWAGEDVAIARASLERAVRTGRTGSHHGRLAWSLGHLGYLDLMAADLAAARGHVLEAVEIMRHSGEQEGPLACVVRIAHSWLLLVEGRPAEAEAELLRSLELARASREPLHVGSALRLLAECRHAARDRTGAGVYLEEARAVVDSCESPGRLHELVERTAATIGPTRSSRFVRSGHDELSDRELDVLRMLAGRQGLPAIASELFVSHNTVKTHCKAIYRKLDVTSRGEAVSRAHDLGILRGRTSLALLTGE